MPNHNEMIPENEKHSASVQAPTNLDSISKIVKWIAILIVAILIAPRCVCSNSISRLFTICPYLCVILKCKRCGFAAKRWFL